MAKANKWRRQALAVTKCPGSNTDHLLLWMRHPGLLGLKETANDIKDLLNLGVVDFSCV